MTFRCLRQVCRDTALWHVARSLRDAARDGHPERRSGEGIRVHEGSGGGEGGGPLIERTSSSMPAYVMKFQQARPCKHACMRPRPHPALQWRTSTRTSPHLMRQTRCIVACPTAWRSSRGCRRLVWREGITHIRPV
eukprot:270746-Chlamydomonas_euryale.AAC.2